MFHVFVKYCTIYSEIFHTSNTIIIIKYTNFKVHNFTGSIRIEPGVGLSLYRGKPNQCNYLDTYLIIML